METDFFQLPELKDIQELIAETKQDIEEETRDNPDVAEEAKFIKEVVKIVEAKIAKHKDLNSLALAEKIDIAAHISFLHSMLEEFFFEEFDFDDEEFLDEDLEADEEE